MDENGHPYIPAYYGSKIYIDLSDESRYSDNYEQLLRWIFDKPFYVKPELGTTPDFLETELQSSHINTNPQHNRAMDALRHSRPNLIAAAKEYLSTAASEFEKLRISSLSPVADDAIVKNVESFLPFRNELVAFFNLLALHRDDSDTRDIVHRFFDDLIPFLYRPPEAQSWTEIQFDNFRFIIQELFMYALACFLKHERFETIDYILRTPYLDRNNPYSERLGLVSFRVFNKDVESLRIRNQRLNLRRYSIRVDMLKDRCALPGINFDLFMEIDFLLYLRGVLTDSSERPWYPETLVYLSFGRHGFEHITRAISQSYFEKLKVVLGVEDKKSLRDRLEEFEKQPQNLIRWQFDALVPSRILNLQQLATVP